MPYTIPSDTHTAGDTGHTSDHNNIADMLTLVSAVNVKNTAYAGGATGNGATDDTTAFQAAVTAAAGGIAQIPPGIYLISAPITIGAGTTLLGSGPAATVIRVSASFTGAAVFPVTAADGVTVSGLTITGISTTYSSNPAAAGITVTHSNNAIVRDADFNYLNGWAVTVTSDATRDSFNTTLDNAHSFQCAQGCQLVGTASADHNQNTQLIGCNFDQCQNSDALQILDVHDVQVVALKATCTAGTGRCINIAGNSAGIFISDPDLGPATFAHEAIVIQASGGNSPANIAVHGGIAEGCTPNLSITGASQNIDIDGVFFLNGQTSGVSVAGTASAVTITNCQFTGDGQAGGTNYDLVWSSTGKGLVTYNWFNTPSGAGAGQVTAALNPSAGTVIADGNYINGAPAFNVNFPKKATSNIGYNPVGHVTSPGLPGTGVALANPFGSDAFIVITGAVTAISIGGTATGLTTAPATIFLPWNQTITMTYTGTPVWTWFLS